MISLLYVDDEPELLDLCKLFLEREGGFSVVTVTSAREGLLILKEGMIDAIVSDYQMPVMDGIEFLKLVRMEFADIPFILFTGKGREEVVIQAINNGADFYLQKGGDPRAQFSELSHKIRQAFRRKKAEEELRMMKSTVSNAAEGILWINKNGGITFFNDTICLMLGYSREEFAMLSVGDINPRFIKTNWGDFWPHMKERKYITVQDTNRKKDGSIIPVEILFNYTEFGPQAYVFAFVRDITDRKRAEDELKSAYEKNQGLMDHANDAIFISDAETGILLDANIKAQNMIGRTLVEIQTMYDRDLLPQEQKEKYQAYSKKYAREGTGLQAEVVDKKGDHIPVIISSTILDLGGRRSIMGIFHDISGIKKTQDALQLANKKLNLLAEITRHDIRNKLTVLGGYLELFTDHPPEPQYSMYLEKLKAAAKMIAENIEFTKLYQDLGVVAPGWKNVNDTFYRACIHIDIKKIRFESSVDGLEIFADPLLDRVFYNILHNAVEHGDHVSVVKLSSVELPDGLLIRIEDDGIGIPVREKEIIFDRGFGKNTGLGLFLCREILSITDITITESGEFQQGARFEMHIPKGVYRFV
ncbi:MAG: PAS domain S-box protein [Methanoregula sp.]|jgi:PAS domain S-box-containing protein|nr:PAS domain S-box protein [Methanoregula sp.]